VKVKYPYTSLSAMFNPLYSKTNQELYKSTSVNKYSHYEKCEWCVPINYHLKSEVSIKLHGKLPLHSSTIRCYSKSTSVIKLATMKNTDDFHYAKEAIMWPVPPNRHLLLSAKMNGTQRRTLVSP